jgi:hypothetical protein
MNLIEKMAAEYVHGMAEGALAVGKSVSPTEAYMEGFRKARAMATEPIRHSAHTYAGAAAGIPLRACLSVIEKLGEEEV